MIPASPQALRSASLYEEGPFVHVAHQSICLEKIQNFAAVPLGQRCNVHPDQENPYRGLKDCCSIPDLYTGNSLVVLQGDAQHPMQAEAHVMVKTSQNSSESAEVIMLGCLLEQNLD